MATQALPHDWWHSFLLSARGPAAAAVSSALAYRAAWVGTRMADGRDLGIPQHEEGLTEAVLLDLRKVLPDLVVHPVENRTKESRLGHDWEWWIEGPTQWFGARVQAKVLHGAPGKEVYSLGYRVGRAAPGKVQPRQVDVLLKAALSKPVPALYALYNPATSAGPTDPGCPTGAPAGAEGVTFVRARTAQWLVDRHAAATSTQAVDVPLAAVAPHALPWSCLAACGAHCAVSSARRPPAHAPTPSDPATAASEFTRTLAAVSAAAFDREDDAGGRLIALLGGEYGEGTFASPPAYVADMLGQQDRDQEQDLARPDDDPSDGPRHVPSDAFDPGLAPSHVAALRLPASPA